MAPSSLSADQQRARGGQKESLSEKPSEGLGAIEVTTLDSKRTAQ
jgi:hypothetical protein